MKLGIMLAAAVALTGCASTDGFDRGQAGVNDQGASIDRCMWMKPRCRSK